MTDRELLEAAAKAAGYSPEWREWRTGGIARFGSIKYTNHEGFWLDGKQWNPLTDDGDALKLVVKLRLTLNCSYSDAALCGQEFTQCKVLVEYNGEDANAATRRAIVRAAAEIGRNMK